MQSATARRVSAVPQRARALSCELEARIRDGGPISFVEYMEACLYHPEYGYYTRSGGGESRDYYTSGDVHPIFARLLARQIEEMWRFAGRPADFQIVELGAGGGKLALELLNFAGERLPEFYERISYSTVERSTVRRNTQKEILAGHTDRGRVEFSEQIPSQIKTGCVISNEFFDALPAHRVVMERGKLREIFVAWDDGDFREVRREPSSSEIADYFLNRGIELREGQQAEVNLAAPQWIAQIGKKLRNGFVVTIDYGHDARELYNERHMRGTLLAYRQHRASEDYYEAPGEQDLTAHVNFTDLERSGTAVGLHTLGRVSQAQFLLALGRANEFADLYDADSGETDQIRARLKLKTLVHPEGMGETFSVLIQSKGVTSVNLTGLQPF